MAVRVLFNLARISSCQNISLVLWLLNHAEAHTAVSASVSLKERKHGSVCPRRKLDGQRVDIFVPLSLIVKHTRNNGYWVLIHIPFSRAQMVLIFVRLFASRSGEEGKLEDERSSVFPPPSSNTVCEQS